MSFKEVNMNELNFNPFSKIGKEWMLVTAGDENKFNTMTASWGGVGVMWGKNVVNVYIRQTRYTKEFIDQNERFTLSYFDEKYRPALNLCGTVSGRDRDKVKEAGLTPYFTDGTTGFEEANMILVCRKMSETFIDKKDFLDDTIDEKWYSDKNYHTMYIAEIEKVLVK